MSEIVHHMQVQLRMKQEPVQLARVTAELAYASCKHTMLCTISLREQSIICSIGLPYALNALATAKGIILIPVAARLLCLTVIQHVCGNLGDQGQT